MLLYVDDILIRSLIHVSKLKATLRSEFDMNNLGDAKWILKMVIAEIEWRVNLDISKDLVMEVLSKFDMDQAKGV